MCKVTNFGIMKNIFTYNYLLKYSPLMIFVRIVLFLPLCKIKLVFRKISIFAGMN